MKKLYIILSFALILRLLLTFYFGNLHGENYWEYGEIAKNIIIGHGYSLFYFNDSELDYHFNENVKPAKSAYMPPGYVFFLLPFMLVRNVFLKNLLIILMQIGISVFTIYLIFSLSKKIFSERVALIAAFLAAITPDLIYADYSFTPTVIFHFLIVLLFIVITNKHRNTFAMVVIGSIIVLICYFRMEFILFAIFFIAYTIFKREYKFSFIILSIIILLLSPWIIRNFLSFDKFVPFTTSFGINLYRGNNYISIGDWGDEKIIDEIRNTKGKNPEIAMNSVYTIHAIDYIKSNPIKILENGPIKIFYFVLYNPNDIRSKNIFYQISAFLYLMFFIYGMIKTFSIKKFRYFYIFFIYFTFVIIIFFPMIRYQTMMKIMMVPFCAAGLADFFYRLNNVVKFHHPAD